MSTTLKIRQLVPSDARVVSHFTQELAKFLKCPDGPKLSTKEIEHHLREKLFSGFVAYVGEVPVGVSTFSITYSSWKGPFMHSEDMYILQEYRRCGLAVKFLNEQFRFAKEHNLSRVEYDAMYWNVPIINLLQKVL
ncbi:hypothetical protein QR680_016077 [Steinernema hermaphroditum]|uniref:N-acetyltransferase domain-containing protein n=1 Tax=Steinernema hermaphroditum TaxID=289476 RepID=A0AA39HCI3_9BILA|nr:hypothetical protein QR680_016077 [Steinernema hermaphroditum]